jgi:hypothetical protein
MDRRSPRLDESVRAKGLNITDAASKLGAFRRRVRASRIAPFAGVALVSFVLGRASMPVREAPAAPAPPSSEPPIQLDLTEDPRATAGIPLRPMDRDVFAEIARATSGQLERIRMKDLFPDRPYKVTFVGSVAERRIGLVLIDLNRDGTYEERWDLKRNDVVRSVQNDTFAEANVVRYTLAHGRWQVH